MQFPYLQFLVQGVPLPQISKRRRERYGECYGMLATAFQCAVHWILHGFTVFMTWNPRQRVNVNAWLPDNEANLVVSGSQPRTGAQGVKNCE